MEKRSYEAIKAIRERVANGTANFHERNIIKIMSKRLKKGRQIEAPKTLTTPHQ